MARIAVWDRGAARSSAKRVLPLFNRAVSGRAEVFGLSSSRRAPAPRRRRFCRAGRGMGRSAGCGNGRRRFAALLVLDRQPAGDDLGRRVSPVRSGSGGDCPSQPAHSRGRTPRSSHAGCRAPRGTHAPSRRPGPADVAPKVHDRVVRGGHSAHVEDLRGVVAVVDAHVAAAGGLEQVLLGIGVVTRVLLDRGAVGGSCGAGVDAFATGLVDDAVPGRG